MQNPSAVPARLVRGDTFDLLSALDAYDLTSTRVVERWLDMELYAEFSAQIDAIRAHSVSVPRLSVLALQLVIAHCELVSAMWQDASVGLPAAKLQEIKERHTFALHALRAAAGGSARDE